MKLAVVLTAISTLASGVALAHHGFQGRYDSSRPLSISGTVERAIFEHPHARLFVRTARGIVEIELPPISRFNALRGRVASGDAIEVEALRNCDPPHQLRARRVRLANGEAIEVAGRAQTEAQGC